MMGGRYGRDTPVEFVRPIPLIHTDTITSVHGLTAEATDMTHESVASVRRKRLGSPYPPPKGGHNNGAAGFA